MVNVPEKIGPLSANSTSKAEVPVPKSMIPPQLSVKVPILNLPVLEVPIPNTALLLMRKF